MTIATVVAICGMIFDVLGAVILARTFFVKRPHEVFRELRSFGHWDFPVTVGARNLLVSWLVQSWEAKTGAVILAFGFVLQAISQALPKEELPWYWGALLLCLATSIWLFFWMQSFFVRQAAREALDFYVELDRETKSEDWKREIPTRRKELEEIEAAPTKWLKYGEPKPSIQSSIDNRP